MGHKTLCPRTARPIRLHYKSKHMTTPNTELKLSTRETEVLKLTAEGLTTKEIAQKLFLSPNTIESHRRSMIKKAQVRNMNAVIFCAMNAGII